MRLSKCQKRDIRHDPHRWVAIKETAQKKPGKNSYIDGIRTRASQIFGTLSKPRRRRQRGHGKTKDLIGRTIAQHVHFKTLYISWPSYAKQQHEITTICVVSEPKPRRQIIFISIWNSTLLSYVTLKLRCGAVWDGRHMRPFFKF